MNGKNYLDRLLLPEEEREDGALDLASPDERAGLAYGAMQQQMDEFAGEQPEVPYAPEAVNQIVEADNAPREPQSVEEVIPQEADPELENLILTGQDEAPELTPQEKLLEEFRKYKEEQQEGVQDARGLDDKMRLMDQLNKSFVQANKALASGYAKVDPKALDLGLDDSEKKARLDYKDRLQNMLQEYKILTGKEEDKLSARDKAYLDYYQEKLGVEKARLGKQEEREERISRKQQLDAARGLIKDDPRTKKAFEQAMALEDIVPLVEQVKAGNQNAAAALGTRLARAMGEVGVLTDADVTRYVQGTSWGRKLLDWYKRGAEGSPSEETLEEIVKNSKTISSKLQGNLKKVYKNAESRMKVAYPDLDKETIKGLLGSPNVSDDTVLMQSPSGTQARVKKDLVQKYLDKGAVIIEE
jgi:hypothetical protein